MNNTLKERVSKMEQGLEDLKEKVDEGFSRLEKKLDCLNQQYAAKWVEKFIYGLISGGALYFIYEMIKRIGG